MNKFSIKEVSNILNISEQAIRLYERKKLIAPIRNDKNNYREYSMEDVHNIYKIIKLNRLGFSLADIYNFKNSKFNYESLLSDKVERIKKEILFELAEYEYMTMVINDLKIAKKHLNEPQLREIEMDIYYQQVETNKTETYNDEQKRFMAIGDIGVIYDSFEMISNNSGELTYMLCSEFIVDKSFIEANLINSDKIHYHKFIQVFFETNDRDMFIQLLNKCLKKLSKKFKLSNRIVAIPMLTIQDKNKIWKVIIEVLD